MQLTTGVTNLTGMLVYNTTATLGAIGIYFWNGATWVKASLPSTSAADSGKFLMSNGSQWVAAPVTAKYLGHTDTMHYINGAIVSFKVVVDTILGGVRAFTGLTYGTWIVPGAVQVDFCTVSNALLTVIPNDGAVSWFAPVYSYSSGGMHLRCYHPSV